VRDPSEFRRGIHGLLPAREIAFMEPLERPTLSQPTKLDTDGPQPPLDQGPVSPASGDAPPVNRSVSETTRFRVVSLHASGGMGNVFVARDDQLNRSVALKEIQERLADDRQMRDRFLREAEVTGQLEHPGIVPVYAMGHYDDGRPYYVMRMIRGDSLKHAIAELERLCSQNDEAAYRLELRRLLNRFITACNTIEYAHSRGVVHRDIKPDNILLGPYGETLVVDWGLAKIVGTSEIHTDVLGETILQSPLEGTQYGTVAGTPSYMSPEQALGWQDAIKPASDVYSLGATLYSLLTGRPPLTEGDLGSLLVRIQKHDFAKPREVNPSIPRPLEAICLKAMAPSMSARYQTALELAADLEAFLAGEPVSAWSEPLTVRAARWFRRHRTLVSTAATTAAVLIVALGVIVLLQNSSNRRLSAANDRETSARKEAEAQRDKAQQNFEMAHDAVDKYFTQVSDDRRLAATGLEPLRRDLLSSAGQFYERLVTQDTHQGGVHYDGAWAKFRLASITDEIAPPAEAAAGFERALDAFRDLTKIEGGNSPHAREGILMCQMNLTSLYDKLGQRAKAQAALTEAIEIARWFLKEYPQIAAAQHHLARCLGIQARRALDAGNIDEAEAAYQDELRLREEIVKSKPKQQTYLIELANNYRNLAVVEQRYERLDQARKFLDESLVIDRRLASENPDDGFLQNTLAQTLTLSGDLAAHDGDGERARQAYREAVELRVALVERHPDVLEYRAALATTADNLAVFCSDRGEYDAAQKYYERALVQAVRLATDYPKIADYQSELAAILVNAAMLCVEQNRLALAQQWLTQALAIREKLLRDAPNDPDRREKLASASLALGIVETDTRQFKKGEPHLRSALAVFQQLAAAHPERPFYTERLGACFKQLADLLKADQRDDQAVAAYHDAQEQHRRLVAAHPSVLKHRLDLASACINLGNLCNRRGQPEPANAAFEEVLALFPEASRAILGVQAKSMLEMAFTGRALAHGAADSSAVVRDFEAAISFAAPERARVLRYKFARVLADSGETERAVALADPLLKDTKLDGETAFELAQVYLRSVEPERSTKAVGHKDGDSLLQRRIEQAIELLQRASSAGFFADPAHRQKLRGSPFVPLLSRNAAFQKLLQALEKAPAAQAAGPAAAR
jgi:serine/threonine protein kinase